MNKDKPQLPENTVASANSLIQRDRQAIWHPYAAVNHPAPLYPVDRAEGVRIYLADGRSLIDGMASWWSVIHGYNHPELNAAVTSQLERMAHVMFGGLTHEPAVNLAEKLVQLTPAGLTRVFFSDSGSVAVEVAIKMAIQYWQSQGQPEKSTLLSFKRGYHGDTFQAMSVCDPDTGMHHLFSGVLSQQIFCDAPQPGFRDPWHDDFLADFRSKLQANHKQLAAVILEPIVQGTGGMRFYHPEFLAGVRQLCDDYKVLLIADEIATGLGRTGKMFGCDHAQVSPDILCLGKTLTGGYMTLAATLCSDEVANGICQGEAGVFMHGPTYMANPLACAVALRSIELLEQANHIANMPHLEAMMSELLAPARQCSCVADVRTLGGIGVVELKQPLDLAIHQDLFVQQGVWVRPFGKLVYIMPPYVINDEELAYLCAGIVRVIEQLN